MAKRKSKFEGKTFVVLVPCRSKKKNFTPGDYISQNDFNAEVIQNWIDIGVLREYEGLAEVKHGGG